MNRKIFIILITLICSVSLIAVSYWYVNGKQNGDQDGTQQDEDLMLQKKLDLVRGITKNDHILGNPEASVIFYVYSDFGCPYCKRYHETLRTLFKLYGDTGEIAYVFRHMPFVELHPNAPMYALASECVAQSGGPSSFWKYADNLFEQAQAVTPPTAEMLVSMAEQAGVNRQSFVACMRANTLMEKVQQDYEEGVAAGGDGTPFTIVETPNNRSVMHGAQPLKTLAYVIKTTIGTLEGVTIEETIQSNDFDNIPMHAGTTSTTTTATTTTATSPLDRVAE